MSVLLILNDGPYGTERSRNGLRLALALAKVEGVCRSSMAQLADWTVRADKVVTF